jgi:hypothetical protein
MLQDQLVQDPQTLLEVKRLRRTYRRHLLQAAHPTLVRQVSRAERVQTIKGGHKSALVVGREEVGSADQTGVRARVVAVPVQTPRLCGQVDDLSLLSFRMGWDGVERLTECPGFLEEFVGVDDGKPGLGSRSGVSME